MAYDSSREMARAAYRALEEKKAENITMIDIEQVSTLADYFIIASGKNRNQIQAMADEVEDVLGRAGHDVKHKEGYQTANWILLDYGDIVIHIFDTQNRLFYDLDRIWRDGRAVSIEELEEGSKDNVD
ncbi:MAG: ribosome silencing factor [Lachnospiraceae bacterium]|nr:ribosome silencing factor [Lachnospiraceae bacterium]